MSTTPHTPTRATGRACAKVLLLGEHSVVYGEGAIALGLPDGITARVSRSGAGPDRLRAERWGLDVGADAPGDHLVARAFGILLDRFGMRGCGVHIEAEPAIPAGVGLGSSGALAIAIARGLAALDGEELGFEALYDAGMAAERVFHGNPSGIDHSVAALGGALWLERRGERVHREPITLAEPLELVVAVAEAGASTKRMVEGVRRRRERVPAAMQPVIAAMGAVVRRARAAVEAGELEVLGELMDIQHGLLVSIGVSTPALDAACHRAREAGALGAKLTGAGGGGCVVALTPGSTQEAVARALRSDGMEVLCPTLQP